MNRIWIFCSKLWTENEYFVQTMNGIWRICKLCHVCIPDIKLINLNKMVLIFKYFRLPYIFESIRIHHFVQGFVKKIEKNEIFFKNCWRPKVFLTRLPTLYARKRKFIPFMLITKNYTYVFALSRNYPGFWSKLAHTFGSHCML